MYVNRRSVLRANGLGYIQDEFEFDEELDIYERERRRDEEEHKKEVEIMQQATQAYPDLPPNEAFDRYQRAQQAQGKTQALTREYWPLLGAVAAGVVLLTVMRK